MNPRKTHPPDLPPVDLVRQFIFEHPHAGWGPELESAIRDGFVEAGCKVAGCSCLETHAVVRIRLRSPQPELELREVKRRIRALAKAFGYRAPADGMAITGSHGAFDGAFTLESEYGQDLPRPELTD